MTFASTFGRVLSPTFQPNSQAVGGKWWLAGNINPANCVAAYQAKGAANLASAKVNLANPGTYDLMAVNGNVGFSTANGKDAHFWQVDSYIGRNQGGRVMAKAGSVLTNHPNRS